MLTGGELARNKKQHAITAGPKIPDKGGSGEWRASQAGVLKGDTLTTTYSPYM